MVVQIPFDGQAVIPARRQARVDVHPKAQHIKYVVAGTVLAAEKLDPADFSAAHLHILHSATLTESRQLVFNNSAWHSVWLGAGEEKSVYLVVDEMQRAFAVELLVKDGYQYGHLTEGYYLAEFKLSQFAGLKRVPTADLSLVYSGEVKVREFIYGETLADICFKATAGHNLMWRLVDRVSKWWAQQVVSSRYTQVRRTFRDAHEANVVIELIPLANPQRKQHFMLPVPMLAQDGGLHWYFYRLTPIDVRAGN